MKKLLILPLVTLLLTIGCEKEVVDHMQQFYNESVGLKDVEADSVKAFSAKFNNYIANYPEEREHRLYPLIEQNINDAVLKITITCDTAWDGHIFIKF